MLNQVPQHIEPIKSSTATMRCRCRDEVFPGFSLFIGCRWEIINGDSCPGTNFVTTTTAAPTTTGSTASTSTTVATTATTTAATTPPPTLKPGAVSGVGHLDNLDQAFKVHIDGLQLQVDQIRKQVEDQDQIIHDYEIENEQLKNKLKEMEGLLSGEDMRDVVEGMFSLSLIELCLSVVLTFLFYCYGLLTTISLNFFFRVSSRFS